MVIDKTMAIGAGGAVLGLLLGYAVGSAGNSEMRAQLNQARNAAAEMASVSESVGALTGRLDGIESALAGVEAAQSESLGGVSAKLDEIEAGLGGLGATVGEAVTGSLSSGLDSVRSEIAALAARPAAVASDAALQAAEPAGAPSAAADVAAGDGIVLMPGQTATLEDGATRVFLSAANAAAGTARVAIAGQGMTMLSVGTPVSVGACTLELAGIEGGAATLGARCNGEAAADAAPAAAEAPAGPGRGMALRPGETRPFGPRGMGVFLSGADAERGTARVAIGGHRQLHQLQMGERLEMNGCFFELTGIEGTGATIDAECEGAEPEAASEAASEAVVEAAAAPVPEGSGAGTAIRIGETAVLADGALRVFLSAVDAEAGTARAAVNGAQLVSLTIGTPVEAGDCTVELTGIDGRSATVDGSC